MLPPREELILKSPPFILIFPAEPLIKVLRFPKKKFDELITKLLFEPLINAPALLPKKNVGVSIETLLPLTLILPFDPLTKLVASPKKNFDELIIKLLFEPLINAPALLPKKMLAFQLKYYFRLILCYH